MLRTIVLLVVFVLMPTFGFAQFSPPTSFGSNQDTIEQAVVNGAKQAVKDRENGATSAAPASSGVTLIADQDNSKAKLSLAFPLGVTNPGGDDLVLSATTPAKKGDDVTEFRTLDGPAEEVEIAIGWKHLGHKVDDLEKIDFSELASRQLELCRVFQVETCSDFELEKAMEKALPDREAQRRVADLLRVRVEGEAELIPITQVFKLNYFSVVGSVGRTERKYFNESAAEKEESRLAYLLSLEYGWVLSKSQVSTGLTYKRKFKDQDKATRCKSIDGSDILEACKELPFGEADEIDLLPLSFEFRFWRDRFLLWPFDWAASPVVAYDLKREIWAASVPIYLVQNSKNQFTGGVRADWEEGKDLTAAVFVTVPLKLF